MATLLERLDIVGVHQSVAARYCKEAATEIRRLETAIREAKGLMDCDDAGYDNAAYGLLCKALDPDGNHPEPTVGNRSI